MSTPSDRFLTGSLTGSFSTCPTTGSPVPSPTGTGTGGSGSFWNRNRWNQSTTKSTTQPISSTDQEAPMTSKRNDRKATRRAEAEARAASATRRGCGHKHTDMGAAHCIGEQVAS